MTISHWIFVIILFVAILISIQKNKLTITGAITGGVIACFIYLGSGLTGIAMLGLFFLLGTLATSWKKEMKAAKAGEEKDNEKRNAGQVIANGGVPSMLGLFAWYFPQQAPLLTVMMASALASATADTLSSELGTIYGKKFYNILNFKSDRRGENGVVSNEGIFIGILGSILIALVYAIGFGLDAGFLWIVIAGTVGNISDSILGATLERKRYIKNDAVNLGNTIVASLAAWGLIKLFE